MSVCVHFIMLERMSVSDSFGIMCMSLCTLLLEHVKSVAN